MAGSRELLLILGAVPSDVITSTPTKLAGRRRNRRRSPSPRLPAKRRRLDATQDDSDAEDNETQKVDDIKPKKMDTIKRESPEHRSLYSWQPDDNETEITDDTQIDAIDFGMSGSAEARAPSMSKPADVAAETSWPGSVGRSIKVPTILATIEDNPDHRDFDHDHNKTLFGFEVPEVCNRREFFKVGLDYQAELTKYDDPILKENDSAKLVKIDQTPKNHESMKEALSALRKIRDNRAQDDLGSTYPDTKFIHVLTFPAALSQKGLQDFRDLVNEAGFVDNDMNKVVFLSEAHAAAMSGFTSSRSQVGDNAWQRLFKVGVLLTVVDIGALTVDVTTAEVLSNDPKPKLAEVTISSGGRCGTSAIHCHLMKELKAKLGPPLFATLSAQKFQRHGQFFRDCEKHLRSFDGKDLNKVLRIRLSLPHGTTLRAYDGVTGEVLFTGSDFKKAVDATLQYTKDLLQDQWAIDDSGKYNPIVKILRTTMLCGGGSLIPYVSDTLKTFCSQNGIQYLRAKDPEAAVCRGAVISQLETNPFVLRKSRANFGIQVEDAGRRYVHWFIKKDEVLDMSKETVFKSLAGNILVTHNEMLNASSAFELPVFMHEKGRIAPSFASHPDVERVSTITISPSGMSGYLKKILQKNVDGKGWSDKHLKISVNVSVDQSARLFFEAKFDRCRLGKGELRLDHTVPRY